MKILIKDPSLEGEKSNYQMEQNRTNNLGSLPIELQTEYAFLNELFLSLLLGAEINLDHEDLDKLSGLIASYLLEEELPFTKSELLLMLEEIGGELLRFAVEGLLLTMKEQDLKSLEDLDQFLGKEKQLILKNSPALPLSLEQELALLGGELL